LDQDGNKIHELTSDLEIPFEVSSQYLRYIGEADTMEYVNTTTVEENNTIHQYFNLFGRELSVIKSRYSFGIATIILLLMLLVGIMEMTMSKKRKVSDIDLIDKKYKSKMISVTDKSKFENFIHVDLHDFKSLLKVAEEKEELILKYIDSMENMVYYYVMGTTYIYSYHTSKEFAIESSDLVYDI